jgi:hypothetical protein
MHDLSTVACMRALSVKDHLDAALLSHLFHHQYVQGRGTISKQAYDQMKTCSCGNGHFQGALTVGTQQVSQNLQMFTVLAGGVMKVYARAIFLAGRCNGGLCVQADALQLCVHAVKCNTTPAHWAQALHSAPPIRNVTACCKQDQ